MGATRKTLSVLTVGLIDFQSDKERMARSARLTKKATKKQSKLLKAQNELLRAQPFPAQPVTPPPALAPYSAPHSHAYGPTDEVVFVAGAKYRVIACVCGDRQQLAE